MEYGDLWHKLDLSEGDFTSLDRLRRETREEHDAIRKQLGSQWSFWRKGLAFVLSAVVVVGPLLLPSPIGLVEFLILIGGAVALISNAVDQADTEAHYQNLLRQETELRGRLNIIAAIITSHEESLAARPHQHSAGFALDMEVSNNKQPED